MDALLIIALLALPLSTAAVLVAIVMVAVDPRPWTAVVSGLLAATLALAWVLLSYRDGVDADETGGEGNIYSQVGWLVAAVLSASAALTLQWRQAGRQLGRTPSGPVLQQGTGSV